MAPLGLSPFHEGGKKIKNARHDATENIPICLKIVFLNLQCYIIFQCDVFDLNAVDLDDLVKVKVVHDGAGVGSGWYLDKIVVKATADADTRYVFNCGKYVP